MISFKMKGGMVMAFLENKAKPKLSLFQIKFANYSFFS